MSSQATATESAAATPSAAPPPMHPELLLAACHSDHESLTRLLNAEAAEAAAASQADHRGVIVEIERQSPAAVSSSSLLLRGVTPDGDTVLHVIAAAGDGDRHLRSARAVHGRAGGHLLASLNRARRTPLHRAARAGNVRMLSLLVDLLAARDGDERVAAVLGVRNEVQETALHEAVRGAADGDDTRAVDLLMRAASACGLQLARDPPGGGGGASPLFLAVSLRRYGVARALHAWDDGLSYAGPQGQNALHAAVLRSQEMTELLLQWNKQLSKEQDDHGNTPLHFAVSVEHRASGMLPRYAVPVQQGRSIATLLNIADPPLEVTRQLVEADPHSACRPNRNGSFPIHVAAAAGRLPSVIVLVARYPGCAGLRDSDGRTFLHVAAKSRRYDVVAFACQTPTLSPILNMQDKDGNTALHLAVEVGDWWIFACLFVNKQVDLDLPNNKQRTPRDLSIISIPTGLYCLLTCRILIQETLTSVNATRGFYRLDLAEYQREEEDSEEEKGAKIVSDSTQFLGVGLVLVTTMAFGATFALPGGYRADDHPNGGTPTLAQLKQFQGFMMANTLAFFCSSLAVLSLVFAGTPTVELPMRYMHYNISIWLSLNAIGSLAIAFALAVYIMMTPVAAKTAVAVIVVIVSVGTLHSPSIVEKFSLLLIVLCIKVGVLPVLKSSIGKVMLLMCWPLVVIFGWQEYASR